MDEVVNALLRAVAFGTPLLFGALGALVNERAGVVNLGIEGVMSVGALAGFAAAYGGAPLWLACLAAMLAGAALCALHALACITLRANQFVSGLALALLGVGLSGLLGKRYEGFPLLEQAPGWPFAVGGLALALVCAVFLRATRAGLVLRSAGENPAALDALGYDVTLVRWAAVLAGGAVAALGGAFLSLSYRPSWTDGMVNGVGWVAVALVIFVGWSPLRAVFGALFFGLLYYLQFRLQGVPGVPTEVFAALPYLLVIVVLAFAGARRAHGHAPAALGRPFERGAR